MLFGSDGPWLHPGVELHKIRLLGLAPAGARLVLGENLLRLTSRARRRPRGRVAVALADGALASGRAPRAADPWQGEQFPVGGR